MKTQTMRLTGGTIGKIYLITNTITLASGRVMQETLAYNCVAIRDS